MGLDSAMPRTVFVVALISALFAYASLQTGATAVLNAPWLDFLQRSLPRSESLSPVVLVESRSSPRTRELVAGAPTLHAAGARQVGVMADPAQARAVQGGLPAPDLDVEVAWPARPSGGADNPWATPPAMPAEASVFALTAGSGPLYRSQPLFIPTQQGKRPTIEAKLARIPVRQSDPFVIDYRGGLAHLPRVSLASAAEGNFLTSVIDGRIA